MTDTILSDELRRFIQSIESIPHLEAMLLLRQSEINVWDENTISKRLYLTSEKATKMLADLCALGICMPATEGHGFVFLEKGEFTDLIDQLAIYYSGNLIEVTNIIHSKKTLDRVQLFADAFKFKRSE